MARYVACWELGVVAGPAVAVDVIRAFTTAAYAFGAGAREIRLVDDVDQAHTLIRQHPGWLAMGEVGGRRPPGFALSSSPVSTSLADLEGRVIVQRTSAGTRGAVAAADAQTLLCASLVVASATAAYLREGPPPTYVITGRFQDDPRNNDEEDLAVAEHIEAIRTGRHVDVANVVRAVLAAPDAAHTMTLVPDHAHPDDLAYCVDVDRFEFAMVCVRDTDGLILRTAYPRHRMLRLIPRTRCAPRPVHPRSLALAGCRGERRGV